ncbi:phage antirepressor N-terminal domain-containing protein [Pseudomonas sp. NPDC086581]|uniref:phage antirepressor N-terminal domain-containing protein n=1 Tax=Pseudomonas sp. NPDC086581 TaxID=3364432 RepID=UPI0037F69A23
MSNQLFTINFHGQPLISITTDDGQHLVAMRPVCEGIGLTWHGQFERIKRDDVLSTCVRVIRTVAQDEKNRELVCLPIEYLNGWLFGIDTRRCRQEIRPALIRYKRECYQVLAAHWQPKPAELDAFDRNIYIKEQLATARFILSFQPDGRMVLNELERKGIYVHVDELASYIDSKITRIPPETIGGILQAIAKRVVQASS